MFACETIKPMEASTERIILTSQKSAAQILIRIFPQMYYGKEEEKGLTLMTIRRKHVGSIITGIIN
jgi:hypothetical protein